MVFELFSQRDSQKKDFDVYEYENFPSEFRNQVFFIISDFINLFKENNHLSPERIYDNIYGVFIRQKGIKSLTRKNYTVDTQIELYMSESDSKDFIDFIDFVFTYIDKCLRKQSFNGNGLNYGENKKADESIEELNYRFRQYGLGYEFIDGQIIKKTNELIHQEVIKPVLSLLHDKRFKGAEEEFLKAFESYKSGNNKDALMNAQKSFESTMKCICKARKIEYNEEDTSRFLIKRLVENRFIPPYQDNYLNNLEQVLSGGLPTIRNKEAGHGQGEEVKNVDICLVEYAIHLAATNIVYLVSLLKENGGK